MSDQLPPPSADSKKADKYLAQLIDLINTDKLLVSRTDLSKFDPTSMQNHYRVNLDDYEIEVSHTKQADSGQDFYIMLFNNLKRIYGAASEKIILAYMHLTQEQFNDFKDVSDKQLAQKAKEAEEKRFTEVMEPIDKALANLTDSGSNLGKDDVDNSSTFPIPLAA